MMCFYLYNLPGVAWSEWQWNVPTGWYVGWGLQTKEIGRREESKTRKEKRNRQLQDKVTQLWAKHQPLIDSLLFFFFTCSRIWKKLFPFVHRVLDLVETIIKSERCGDFVIVSSHVSLVSYIMSRIMAMCFHSHYGLLPWGYIADS